MPLHYIESDDPERVRAYVLEVFEAAEAPPDCFRDASYREPGDDRPDCTSDPWDTTFCSAGAILYREHVHARLKDPDLRRGRRETHTPQHAYEAVGLEPNAARWWDRCWGM